jgi:hypothetical protein
MISFFSRVYVGGPNGSHWKNRPPPDLPVEDFLFGAVVGYAVKKVMKIVAAVVGLFVAG